jgi:hypothetical protein
MVERNKLDVHPIVVRVRQRSGDPARPSVPLDAARLRELCLQSGADAVGFVEIDRAEIADQRAEVDAVLPGARALISFVCRLNRENIRSPARSV